MRKLKAKKEKKKIDKRISALSIEDEMKLEISLYLTNIAEATRRHIEVWKREISENDGFLDENVMIILECIVATSTLTRDRFLQDVSLTPNLSTNPIIAKCMALCYSCFGEDLPLTDDDVVQRLPRGFMGTIGALARTTKALLDKRLEKIQEQIGMLDEVGAVGELVEKYLNWVHEQITFKELLKVKVNDSNIKMQEKALLYKYNKGVLNGDFIDLEVKNKVVEEKTKKQLTVEEINMKTDKEMIKEMLIEEKEKVEKKKKGGRPKKVKEEEVVEAVEEKVEDNPVNPNHYNTLGFNTIELIAGHLGKVGAFYFYLGNAFKYLLRAENKNGKEDYLKAKQYLEWIVANEEKGSTVDVSEVLHKLETNWLTVSINILSSLNGAKALLLNAVFENFFKGEYKVALEQLEILLGSDD